MDFELENQFMAEVIDDVKSEDLEALIEVLTAIYKDARAAARGGAK